MAYLLVLLRSAYASPFLCSLSLSSISIDSCFPELLLREMPELDVSASERDRERDGEREGRGGGGV